MATVARSLLVLLRDVAKLLDRALEIAIHGLGADRRLQRHILWPVLLGDGGGREQHERDDNGVRVRMSMSSVVPRYRPGVPR